MADTVPAVEEAARFTYTLDVPLAKSGAIGGAETRFSCCHQTAAQGHSGHCDLSNREQTIRTALERAGFEITAPGTLTPGGEDTAEEDRAWLAEFLNHAPRIDPHDDEAVFVDLLAPFALLLRICVDERDRRASMDKQPGEGDAGDHVETGILAFDAAVAGGLKPGELHIITAGPTKTGRMSSAAPNLGQPPKSAAPSIESYESPEMQRYGHPSPVPGETTQAFRERTGAEPSDDPVNHPRHYNTHPAGIECVDVNEHMAANIAAAVKYVWRAGLKPGASHDQDLAKAVWYIERERARVRRMR